MARLAADGIFALSIRRNLAEKMKAETHWVCLTCTHADMLSLSLSLSLSGCDALAFPSFLGFVFSLFLCRRRRQILPCLSPLSPLIPDSLAAAAD